MAINSSVLWMIMFICNYFIGNLISLIQNVGVYCMAALCGITIHLTITLPSIFYFYTRENPYEWIYSCRKAVLVALSTSSSVRVSTSNPTHVVSYCKNSQLICFWREFILHYSPLCKMCTNPRLTGILCRL